MTTVTDAVAALRERLDEPTAAQWTDVSLRRWLNEAIRDMARRTRMYRDTETIVVTQGTGEYAIPAEVMHIYFAYFAPTGDSRQIPLEARAWEAMNQIWWDQQDQAAGYPCIFTTFGYAPTLKVKLYPVPTVGGNLLLHVARLPATLDIAAGTGNVDAPEAWIETALDYAEYMALRKDRDQRWQEAFQLYEAKVQGMIEMGESLNAPHEFVQAGGGMYPSWLVAGDGYGW